MTYGFSELHRKVFEDLDVSGWGFELSLRLARESGVQIVENPPLARTLYQSVKVGGVIPERLFQVVAELLAYVYRMDRRRGEAW